MGSQVYSNDIWIEILKFLNWHTKNSIKILFEMKTKYVTANCLLFVDFGISTMKVWENESIKLSKDDFSDCVLNERQTMPFASPISIFEFMVRRPFSLSWNRTMPIESNYKQEKKLLSTANAYTELECSNKIILKRLLCVKCAVALKLDNGTYQNIAGFNSVVWIEMK